MYVHGVFTRLLCAVLTKRASKFYNTILNLNFNNFSAIFKIIKILYCKSFYFLFLFFQCIKNLVYKIQFFYELEIYVVFFIS